MKVPPQKCLEDPQKVSGGTLRRNKIPCLDTGADRLYRPPEGGDETKPQRQLHVDQAEASTIGALFADRECALRGAKKVLIPLTTLCDECSWEVDRKLRYVEKIVGGKVT